MRSPTRIVLVILLAALLVSLAPSSGRAAVPPPAFYTVAEVGTLPGASEAAALAINEYGQVAGYALIGTEGAGFLHEGGQSRDLRPSGLHVAQGINNHGQIVGGGLLLSGGVTTSLRPTPDAPEPIARAINDRAQIVGDGGPGPFFWERGRFTPLLPGRAGSTSDINNTGQIALTELLPVGQFATVRSARAYRYDVATGALVDLQAQVSAGAPVSASAANGINEAGHIVGYAAIGERSVPLLWRDGAAIDLGGFGAARNVNDADHVVGYTSADERVRATLWRDGRAFDLNDLIPADSDWTLTEAVNINNAGQIVGVGTRADGRLRAFLLTPRFTDLSPADSHATAIVALAGRGIIRGYGDGTVGPGDPVLRAQAAGLVARVAGWGAEDWPDTTFPDQGATDDDLWRDVRTLAHYGVARGYEDGTYNPTGQVTRQQVALLTARALVTRGVWTLQPDTAPYPNLPADTARAREDRRMIATYVHYAGPLPEYPTGQPWAAWDQPATRGWAAEVLWRALGATPTP